MKNIENFNDIETINYYNTNPLGFDKETLMKNINFASRDGGRRPIPWTDEENSGFDGKPWLSVYNNYKEINVQTDLKAEKRVGKYYRDLLHLRNSQNAFINGRYEDLTNYNHYECGIFRIN